MFRRHDQTFRVSVGQPIMPDEQAQYESLESLGEFLRERTYSMRKWDK